MDTSKTTLAGYATAAAAVFTLVSSYLAGAVDLATTIGGCIAAVAAAFGFKSAADAPK